MASKFSETLSSLRKAQNLSQKQAAQDLGISQALLSHYEKGIRECGLDFLCRAADYYGVTTDYLLGHSSALPDRQYSKREKQLTEFSVKETLPKKEAQSETLCRHYGRLCNDSLTIIFALWKKINSNTLTKEASNYLFVSIYEIYNMLGKAGSQNKYKRENQSEDFYLRLSLFDRRCRDILSGNVPPDVTRIDQANLPSLTKEMLLAEFDHMATSMLELIELACQPLPCIWQTNDKHSINYDTTLNIE